MAEADPRGDGWLTLIGVGKAIKVAALVTLGVLVLVAEHDGAAATFRHWVFRLGISPGNHLVGELLARADRLGAGSLRAIALVSFAYAALFSIEATGLLLHRRWGEWATVFITGSFIPIEVYETALHPHVGRVVAIVLNVAAVAYLLWRLFTRDRRVRRGGRARRESFA